MTSELGWRYPNGSGERVNPHPCPDHRRRITRPQKILFSPDLPKIRLGKIMRRLVRDIAAGKVVGDTTALADTAVVERLKKQHEETEE